MYTITVLDANEKELSSAHVADRGQAHIQFETEINELDAGRGNKKAAFVTFTENGTVTKRHRRPDPAD